MTPHNGVECTLDSLWRYADRRGKPSSCGPWVVEKQKGLLQFQKEKAEKDPQGFSGLEVPGNRLQIIPGWGR